MKYNINDTNNFYIQGGIDHLILCILRAYTHYVHMFFLLRDVLLLF